MLLCHSLLASCGSQGHVLKQPIANSSAWLGTLRHMSGARTATVQLIVSGAVKYALNVTYGHVRGLQIVLVDQRAAQGRKMPSLPDPGNSRTAALK